MRTGVWCTMPIAQCPMLSPLPYTTYSILYPYIQEEEEEEQEEAWDVVDAFDYSSPFWVPLYGAPQQQGAARKVGKALQDIASSAFQAGESLVGDTRVAQAMGSDPSQVWYGTQYGMVLVI